MSVDVGALWQEYVDHESVTAAEVASFAFAPEPLGLWAWDNFFSRNPDQDALESLVFETPDDVVQQLRVIGTILGLPLVSFGLCTRMMECFKIYRSRIWSFMSSLDYVYDDLVRMIREIGCSWEPAVELFLSSNPKPEHLCVLLRTSNSYNQRVWKQMIGHPEMRSMHANQVLLSRGSMHDDAADWIMKHAKGRLLRRNDVSALFRVMVRCDNHADEAWRLISACEHSLIDDRVVAVFNALTEDYQLIVWDHMRTSKPSEAFCMKVVHHAVSGELRESAARLIAPRLTKRRDMMHIIAKYPDLAESVARRLFEFYDGRLAYRHLARLRNHVPDLVDEYERRDRLSGAPRDADEIWNDLDDWVEAQKENVD